MTFCVTAVFRIIFAPKQSKYISVHKTVENEKKKEKKIDVLSIIVDKMCHAIDFVDCYLSLFFLSKEAYCSLCMCRMWIKFVRKSMGSSVFLSTYVSPATGFSSLRPEIEYKKKTDTIVHYSSVRSWMFGIFKIKKKIFVNENHLWIHNVYADINPRPIRDQSVDRSISLNMINDFTLTVSEIFRRLLCSAYWSRGTQLLHF